MGLTYQLWWKVLAKNGHFILTHKKSNSIFLWRQIVMPHSLTLTILSSDKTVINQNMAMILAYQERGDLRPFPPIRPRQLLRGLDYLKQLPIGTAITNGHFKLLSIFSKHVVPRTLLGGKKNEKVHEIKMPSK